MLIAVLITIFNIILAGITNEMVDESRKLTEKVMNHSCERLAPTVMPISTVIKQQPIKVVRF